MVLNRDIDTDIVANININNFIPKHGAMEYKVTASSIDSNNESDSDNVRMSAESMDIMSGKFQHIFSKHSVSVLVIPTK